MPDENEQSFEHRKFKRIDQHFMAKFQTTSEDAASWHTIFLRDLGAGGVLFNHSSEVITGSDIRLSILFPMSKTPLFFSATVVRVRSFEIPLRVYEIAACFTDVDETQKDLIVRAAEVYFSKKKKPS